MTSERIFDHRLRGARDCSAGHRRKGSLRCPMARPQRRFPSSLMMLLLQPKRLIR
jgi:hypothetical protein